MPLEPLLEGLRPAADTGAHSAVQVGIKCLLSRQQNSCKGLRTPLSTGTLDLVLEFAGTTASPSTPGSSETP
jgi:hypothetical protein